MTKKISANQLALILIITIVSLKLSLLPSVICSFAGNNAYISCLISLAIDFGGVVIILAIMYKMPDTTFFDLTKQYLGKGIAVIIQALMLIYFFLKSVIAILELHDYFISTLFEDINTIFFFVVLLLLLIFLFTKNFRTFGRLLEICFWPMALGLLFTLIYPASELQLINLLPIFPEGIAPVLRGVIHSSFSFGDYIILIALMGKLDTKKKSKKKIILASLSAMVFTFNFYVIFIGTFGDFTINQTLALSELPLHNPYPATVGKLEWLTIIIWTALLILNASLMGKCCCESFDNIFGTYGKNLSSCVISGLIGIFLIVTYLGLEKISFLVTGEVLPIIFLSFQILLLILLLIGYFISKKKHSRRRDVSSIKVGN